jgi:hypothetical protein
MKISKRKLKRVIREEVQRLTEEAVMKYTSSIDFRRSGKAYREADVEVKKDEDYPETTWVVKGPRREVERWIDTISKGEGKHIRKAMYDAIEGGSKAAKMWSKARRFFSG